MAKQSTFIIAEIGVNHNGDMALAETLIDGAIAAGADAVKFQAFHVESLVTKDAASAEYQRRNTGREQSQFELLSKLRLDAKQLKQLARYSEKKGMAFMASAFDESSLQELLTENPNIRKLKIGSGEITNWPFLWLHGQYQKELVLSTGMANLGEIEQALAVLAAGYCEPRRSPTDIESCFRILQSEVGQSAIQENVILLHCTSSYPAPTEAINLRAMDTLKAAFSCRVGYSDHSSGPAVALAAVARGAVLIEKHITVDTALAGPDHKASMPLGEFSALVKSIREVEVALGSDIKLAQTCELDTRRAARKSLVAARDIKTGDTFDDENTVCLRPGTGMSASNYWHLQGRTSSNAYQTGDLIDE